MKTAQPNTPSAKEQTEQSRTSADVDCPPGKNSGAEDFKSKGELDGKTDSGPEPEVHGKEIPPQ